MSVVVITMISATVFAQDPDTVTIADLNAYDNLTEFSQDTLQAHPLNGVDVVFTAVIVSYPKNSGLATPNDTDNDGEIDDIGRIHVFVTDTSANSMGRDGMSIQIVESDYELLGGYTRGDVITVTGALSFFNATAQMTADAVDLVGNVNQDAELADYAALLEPWEISLDELNTLNPDGTHEINFANYSKYNGAYVKISGGTISNVSLGDRPNWAVNADGSRIYAYDTSLRYRNDRASYLPGWNWRHEEDGDFEPIPGSVVNVSGFINLVGDDPDGNVAAGTQAFSINPFEDGVLWTGGVRYEDGDEIPGVGILDWPNDYEVVGLPPVFSEASQSDSIVTSSDAVTVSVNVVGVEAKTISSVDMVYSAAGVTDTLDMTAAGDVYSAEIPAQANFTAVSFYFLAEDSEGLIGRDPIAGNYGYFVLDGAINSVALIQQTSDGLPGPSPAAGAGVLEYDLTGWIVADNSNGVIVLQDTAAAWGGVFLEHTTETDALVIGDEIHITAAEATEAAVSNNSLTLTQLTNLEFTVESNGNDISGVIPTLHTDSVVAWTVSGELEPYEGMLVKFEDVQAVDRGAYGEYEFKNMDADSADGVLFNEDIRASATIGDVDVDYAFNHTIRLNKTMDAYAIVAASFGAPKFHPRNAGDFMPADGNAFTPVLTFGLVEPLDSAEVTVTEDLTFDWAASNDFDGDDLEYILVIWADDELVNESDAISGTSFTVDAAQVDSFLVANSVADGETIELYWSIWVTDGSDTLQVHGPYGNFGDDFEPIGRTLFVTNSTDVANEDEFGVPARFALEQNYPNPFNPSTNIKFALPKASEVTLTVYDMLGRKVATLLNGKQMKAANHTVQFNASALASGMYIYRLEAGSFVSTRKMMLIK